MRRVVRFFVSLLIAIFAMIVAESVTSEDADAQRRPPELIVGLRPDWHLIILEYPPPAIYEKWWREIAACEGLPLPDAHYEVQYFAINGREFEPLNDPLLLPWESPGWAIGYAHVWSGQMYLAFPYMMEESIFKHEAAHFLIYWAYKIVGHPPAIYGKKDVGKCGIVPYRREGTDEK